MLICGCKIITFSLRDNLALWITPLVASVPLDTVLYGTAKPTFAVIQQEQEQKTPLLNHWQLILDLKSATFTGNAYRKQLISRCQEAERDEVRDAKE